MKNRTYWIESTVVWQLARIHFLSINSLWLLFHHLWKLNYSSPYSSDIIVLLISKAECCVPSKISPWVLLQITVEWKINNIKGKVSQFSAKHTHNTTSEQRTRESNKNLGIFPLLLRFSFAIRFAFASLLSLIFHLFVHNIVGCDELEELKLDEFTLAKEKFSFLFDFRFFISVKIEHCWSFFREKRKFNGFSSFLILTITTVCARSSPLCVLRWK